MRKPKTPMDCDQLHAPKGMKAFTLVGSGNRCDYCQHDSCLSQGLPQAYCNAENRPDGVNVFFVNAIDD